MTAASVDEVLARCAATPTWTPGMCGQFCAAMYGYPASGYVSAYAQWVAVPTALKHARSSDAPPGALYFWSGGPGGHGHVAVAVGDGSCWSIDIAGAGRVARVPYSQITQQWGLPYLGWASPYFLGQEWSPVMIYGIDVAAYQSDHFPLTLPGDGHKVDFAFIKATEGTSYVNPRMAAQADWARQHGLVVGFYHFLHPGNVAAQADYFVQHAASVDGDLLACDWEPTSSGLASNADKDNWIKTVKDLRPTHKCLLYCDVSRWTGVDRTSYAGDGLWIAAPGSTPGSPPIKATAVIHQYSSSGDIDHDAAQFASRDAMRTWAEEGTDMALSADDKAWLLANIPKAVLNTDNILDAPADSADYATNKFWTLASYVQDTGQRVRKASGLLSEIDSQAKSNGGNLTALLQKADEILALLDDLDLSQLPDEIAAKLNGLKFILQEGSA